MTVQKPKIQISDPQLSEKKFYDEIIGKLLDISESFKFYNTIVVAVFLIGFVILMFTLATLLIQSWQFNSTFQTESRQLRIQEDLIKNTVDEQKNIMQNQEAIKNKLEEIQTLLK